MIATILDYIGSFWNNLQTGILPKLDGWNYLILAMLVAIEGPIATLLGAAASSTGVVKPLLVFAAAAIGNISADMLWYSIGRSGNLSWILKLTRFFGVRQHHLDTLQQGMVEHSRKILFIAKLTAGLIIPSLIAAGLSRVPVKKWFPILLIAETIWTGTLVWIGYYATISITNIERGMEYIALAGTMILILLAVLWGRSSFRKSKTYHQLLDDSPNNQ